MKGMIAPYRIVATFSPLRLDTLRVKETAFVGQRMEFTRLWRIREADGGPYVGQWAWRADVGADGGPRGWVPDEDLTDIVAVT